MQTAPENFHSDAQEFYRDYFRSARAQRDLDDLARAVHLMNVAAGWWTDLETGGRKDRNVGEMLALVHSEISEALEAYRKSSNDAHLPQYPGVIVELVDALIRIVDLLGALHSAGGVSPGDVMVAKLSYNQQRADHKVENRVKNDGKKF